MSNDVLAELVATIRARRAATASGSYTRELIESGPEHCAKKFGEEAVEAVIAAACGSDEALTAEAADVLYHLLVMLEARNVAFDDVLKVIASRRGMSGHAEKAARTGQ